MHWHSIFSKVYPSCIWHMPTDTREVYLTFDDGPTPEVTEAVLSILQQYRAKATFFVIGKNVMAYPALYQQVIDQGHSVGNHTFEHQKGWKTDIDTYVDSVANTANLVASALFRPPYGRISKNQLNTLKHTYRIIMWNVLSYDFDRKQTPASCTKRVLKNIKPGAIVVFHDSEKAKKNMLPTLEACLAYCQQNNLKPVALPMHYQAY